MAFAIIPMRITIAGPTSTARINQLDVRRIWDFKLFAFMEAS